jgi:hypothetical protein
MWFHAHVSRIRRAVELIVVLVLVGACSSGSTVTSPTYGPSSGPTATPAPTTVPTADLANPIGLIAMGHSGLTGEGTGDPSEPNLSSSWATGTRPAVNSVYLRLLEISPATEGNVANTAFGGAPASSLVDQTQAALRAVPAPLLAIIQTVDNDIQCDGSNVSAVGESLAKALAVISAASPNTQILVVGQAGRPSVSFIEALVAFDPSTKAGMTWDDDCSFFDTDGNLRENGVAKLSAVIDEYEAETARVCAAAPNCSTDGGVRKAYVDEIENFSPDYAHFNEKGQAAMAELIWPVVEDLVGP